MSAPGGSRERLCRAKGGKEKHEGLRNGERSIPSGHPELERERKEAARWRYMGDGKEKGRPKRRLKNNIDDALINSL